ncbi:MAG: hypothetical protein QM703_25370 [Gemmatales bacterium]
MNLGGYSSGGGMQWIGMLLLLFLFVGPYLLLWLEVRAFRYSYAQSNMALAMLLLLGMAGCYCLYHREVFSFFAIWLVGFQLLLLQISLVAWPFTVGWEAYKRGWLTMLREKMKGKKKKKKKRQKQRLEV